MSAPPVFPKWLPAVVAQEAERLLKTTKNRELILRLATDSRMKPVWRELKKCKRVAPRYFGGALYRRGFLPLLPGHDEPDYLFTRQFTDQDVADEVKRLRANPKEYTDRLITDHLANPSQFFPAKPYRYTDQEIALALFFWYAVVFAVVDTTAKSVSETDAVTDEYQKHAKQLRDSAAALRRMCKSYDREGEILESLKTSRLLTRRLASLVGDVAGFFDKAAAQASALKEAGSIFPPIKRDLGLLETRGYTRSLAVVTRGLFGTPLYGSLAKVASVAKKEVSLVQVRKWCADLKSRRPHQ